MKLLFKVTNNKTLILLLICLSVLQLREVTANDSFFTARCHTDFPESMLYLQELVTNKGYTISRVQHVDKGLKARGYETGLYRVVFFGKKNEIQTIRNQYPALLPYIPLSITIFESDKYTGISSMDPRTVYDLYQSDKIKSLIETWHIDLADIFTLYNKCHL